jgi:hypothetical protein
MPHDLSHPPSQLPPRLVVDRPRHGVRKQVKHLGPPSGQIRPVLDHPFVPPNERGRVERLTEQLVVQERGGIERDGRVDGSAREVQGDQDVWSDAGVVRIGH